MYLAYWRSCQPGFGPIIPSSQTRGRSYCLTKTPMAVGPGQFQVHQTRTIAQWLLWRFWHPACHPATTQSPEQSAIFTPHKTPTADFRTKLAAILTAHQLPGLFPCSTAWASARTHGTRPVTPILTLPTPIL